MLLVFEYLDYFLFGFTRHLVLFGALALIGAIVCGRVGRSFGLDRLFWHESRPLQLRAGSAVGLLFAKIGFVGYLLDEELLRSLPEFSQLAPPARALAAGLYLALFSIPTAVLWLLLALATPRATNSSTAVPRLPFVLGAGLGLGLSFGLLAAFARVVPSRPALPDWLIRLLFLEDVAVSARPLHLLAALFIAMLTAEYLVYAVTRRGFTPAMALCTLLGLLAGVTGFLEFRAWNGTAVVLTVLLGAWLGGLPRYKLRIAALAHRYDAPIALDRSMGAEQPCAFDLVRSEAVPWSRDGIRRPLVLVSASGGGLRAALWTAEVLSELELALPDFAASIRIIAGASGGMVGASYYALTLRPDEHPQPWNHELSREELIANLGQDSLSSPIKRLLFRDLLLAFLPVHNVKNRGDALESCWRWHFGKAFERSFGELVEHERRGTLPSLVFTPMLVEDGRRLVISNLDLSFISENEIMSNGKARLLSRSGLEFARLFPAEFASLPVRTAARLSAAFPYVSPAVSLPTAPRRRVVDAGYYDNYGVNVCAAWLADSFCSPLRRRWLEQNVSRVLLVQIRDFVSPLAGVSVPSRYAPTALGRGLEGLLSPLHGVIAARESVSVFRNDEQLEQVVRLFDQGFAPGFVRTEIIEYEGQASLSWYLTSAERAAISASARAVGRGLQDLRVWWEGEPARARQSVGVHVAEPPPGDRARDRLRRSSG